MAANANPKLSTITSPAGAVPDDLPVVEVSENTSGVLVKWGEGGAQKTAGMLRDNYSVDPYNFHAFDSNGDEPFVKAFGTLLHCDGGTLTIGRTIYRIQVIQQQQQVNDGIQKLQQFSESARAGIELMGEDYLAKKRTIVLSDATQTSKDELMDMLSLPEKGASWPNKPSTLQCIDGHSWLQSSEDSEENRLAYMAYLRNMLKISKKYELADVQPERQLLNVELFRETTDSRKISGTTDVAIAKSQHVRNHALRNNIETLLELKKPMNMGKRDHSPQTIGEHFAASYLNPDHALVSVLTDLNTRWIFFWYAVDQDDSRMSLHKLDLNGNTASMEAKYLLDSLYDNSFTYSLPTTFAERQTFQAVLENLIIQRKKRRIDLDGNNRHKPYRDSNPSSGGTEQDPGSDADSLSEGKDNSGQQGNKHGTDGDGSAPISMAHALSLFAPPANRDVANELDLLDMLNPNEQYEIVSSFASKHIVPYMRG